MNNYNNGFQNPQMNNQYPQQFPQQYPPYPPQKKSHKKLILVLVLVGVLALVISGIVLFSVFGALNGMKTAKTYDLPNDTVPTVYAVLGEERNINGFNTSTVNGETENRYSYNNVSDVQSDIVEYITYLHDNEGFLYIQDCDTEPLTGSIYMGKNSSKDGEVVIVTINYDKTEGTYDIILENTEGTLQVY